MTSTEPSIGSRPGKPLRRGSRSSAALPAGVARRRSATVRRAPRPGRDRGRERARRPLAWWERPLPIAIGALIAALGGWLLGAGAPDRAPPSPEPVSAVLAGGASPDGRLAEAGERADDDSKGAAMPPPAGTVPGSARPEPATAGTASRELAPSGTVSSEGVSTEIASPDSASGLNEAIVLENRKLAAEVAALETETTELEREMLALDLRLAAMGGGAEAAERDARAGDGDGAPLVAPIELGNTTLVPPPLPEAEIGGRNGAAGFASDDGVLGVEVSRTGTASAEFPDAGADDVSEPFLPQASGDAGEGAGGNGRAAASAGASLPIERLVIGAVEPGSAAAVAGLEPDDVLLGIDGLPVIEFEDVTIHDNGAPAPLHDIEVLRGTERRRAALAGSPEMLTLEMRWIDSARLIE